MIDKILIKDPQPIWNQHPWRRSVIQMARWNFYSNNHEKLMPKTRKKQILMVSSTVYGFEDLLDRVPATLPGPDLNYGVWISNERFSE